MTAVPGPAFLTPEWPVPGNVRACVTLRSGGVSEAGYASLNLAAHVGDRPERVEENRRRVRAALGLPGEPAWLEQVHGTRVLDLDAATERGAADGAITARPGTVCAVLTADCLPVLLADRAGRLAGAAHAGWRGLAAGVLRAAVAGMRVPPGELLAWLGPGIGAAAYEVGDDVRDACLARIPGAARAFVPNARGRWQADLEALARAELAAAGVERVYGGGFCTHSDAARFFSHRREAPCGRMASLIWLDFPSATPIS